jgi:branched-chain amino acid transport system permease protein
MLSTMIFQALLNGVVNGVVYALTAAGFTIIYGNAGILFFALGEIYMLGAIFFYLLVVVVGIHYFPSLGIVVLVMSLCGVLVERLLFRHLKGSELIFAFASLALGMLIAGLALEFFGERGQGVPFPWPGVINIFGAIITYNKLTIGLASFVILFALSLFFEKTKAGWAIRAVSQDTEAAELVGVNVNRTNAFTFALALAITGTAGALLAPLYYIDVFIGAPILTTTLIVVVLGGLGNFYGAIVAGVFIGLVESFGNSFLGGTTALMSFIIVIIILISRPQGLLRRG